MEILSIVLSGAFSTALATIVLSLLNRKWAKDDKRDAVVKAQKLVMLDRVRYLAKQYIAAGHISLDDKENLGEMHTAYKELGGNGHLDLIMKEVDRLPVVGED